MREKKTSINPNRNARIGALFAEMETRYAALKALLEQAAAGEEIDDTRLWLAQSDLSGALSVMLTDPFAQNDE